jgi:hypothetical protein
MPRGPWIPPNHRGPLSESLIATSAIRNSANHPGISRYQIPNRDKTRFLAPHPFDPQLGPGGAETPAHDSRSSRRRSPLETGEILIGSSAIRTCRNYPGINHLHFSNRRKTRFSHIGQFCRRHSRLGLFAGRATAAGHRSQATNHRSRLLISSPVIRIRPKPFLFSAEINSNRHEIRAVRFAPHPSLATGHRSRLRVLIGPPVIRICPKSNRIITNPESNRRETLTRRFRDHSLHASAPSLEPAPRIAEAHLNPCVVTK